MNRLPISTAKPRFSILKVLRSLRSFPGGTSTAVRPARPKEKPAIASSSRLRFIPIPPARTPCWSCAKSMCGRSKTPHLSNARATILDDPGAWFGYEQGNISFGKTAYHSASRPTAIPIHRANTTPALVTGTLAVWPASWSRNTLTSAWIAGSTMKASTLEVAKGQWEFEIFGKGSGARPPIKCGWRATS